jgi:hypothetical protein
VQIVVAEQPDNLALGKKCTLKPPANYHLCTDPQDKVQLTDGVYSKGYFWTQLTTVGWTNAQPVEITMDLEAVQPISGISLNTAAGTAGVQWPVSILLLVSKDAKTYYGVADLVKLSALENGPPKSGGYALHRFATAKLRTHGRYVKLLIFGRGAFIFVDEIEVYKGSDEFLTAELPGEKIEDMDRFYRKVATVRGVRRRLYSDLADIRKLAEESGQISKWREDFEKLEKEIAEFDFDPPPNFRTVFPMNDLHRRIFKIQAALWRTRGLSGLTVWRKNRWDMLGPTELPRHGRAEIDVEMMNNEFRADALNLSNAADRTARIELSIRGLPEGPNPEYISVHEVPFTDTCSGVPIAAAMPELSPDVGKYNIEIEPGMTKQIWFSFHPKDYSPGEHRGVLLIEPAGRQVPVRLMLYPFHFPDRPTLHLGGWDYTDRDNRYQVTPENVMPLIEHLRRRFVDSPWATGAVLPRGKYDSQGNMTEQPDTANFEKWIERWPKARNYYVFASVGTTFAGFKMGTPPFENAVANWIKWWAKKLPQFNIRPQQLGILLVDEPHSHERDDRIIAYAKIMQKAAPEIVVWEDPTWREPWKARPQLFELSDVLCPNLPMLIAEGEKFADFYVRQREAGRRLWFYSCSGPGKLLDPYSYHRLQHWFCWKYKAKGSAFWAFGDSNGASSWNEYLTLRGAYTPVFLDETSVTPGKHMEAIREGIEDFEYLVMLREQISELEKKGRTGPAIQKAKDLLSSAADRVIKGQTSEALYWRNDKDRSVADKVRIEILRTMTQLRNLRNSN